MSQRNAKYLIKDQVNDMLRDLEMLSRVNHDLSMQKIPLRFDYFIGHHCWEIIPVSGEDAHRHSMILMIDREVFEEMVSEINATM